MLKPSFTYKMLIKKRFKNPVNSFVAKVKVVLCTKFQEPVIKYVISPKVISVQSHITDAICTLMAS